MEQYEEIALAGGGRSSRKIYRSQSDKILFGVCGGIAEYYNIESLWIRVIFIFLGVTGAIGFILYLALVVLMPQSRGGDESPAPPRQAPIVRKAAVALEYKARRLKAELLRDPRLERRRNILGLVVVAVGAIAFINELFPNFWIGWKVLWPTVIIFIGLSFISDARPAK